LARFERLHFLRVEHEPSTTAHGVKGLALETPNRALVHTETFGDFVARELLVFGFVAHAAMARHVSRVWGATFGCGDSRHPAVYVPMSR
jgi:hypothetical protein